MTTGATMKLNRKVADLLAEFPMISLERVEKHTHYKLYLDTPTGKQILIVSISASDGRAKQNNRSLLKRWAKGPL
jgi:hypothetical protein